MIYNVRDYGAKGDGLVLDTAAIQAAIDACTANGGGKVLVPPGKYLVGKIVLKDNVTVELAEGSHLIASTRREDYPLSPGFPGSLYNQGYDLHDPLRAERIAIFYACSAKNIGITGRGTVDGQHWLFLPKNAYPAKSGYRWSYAMYNDGDRYFAAHPDFKFRILMVFFEDCQDVVFDGVNYINAPCYTLQLRSCRQVQITNVVIRNHLCADNADGIHMSSCSDVRISNCDLECGDDCIAIDTNDMRPARHFLIQNCTFVSRNNCFRIFTNLAPEKEKRDLVRGGLVSDVVINNCVVKNASSFVFINVDEGTVERVSVTNACGKVDRLGTTFLITAHNAKVRQVTFANWNFRSRGVGYIYADRPGSISGVKLTNLDIHVCPSTQAFGNGMYMATGKYGRPDYPQSHYAPYFLHMVEAEKVSVRDLTVTWGEADLHDIGEITQDKLGNWGTMVDNVPHWPAIWAERIDGLTLDRCDCEAFGEHPHALQLDNVCHALVRDCTVAPEAMRITDCTDVQVR